MISTPLSLFLDRTPPPHAGRAPQAGDVTVPSDFADLVSRFFFSNMPLAALARAAEISDAMAPPPDAGRMEPERKPETAEDADGSDAAPPEDKEKAATAETPTDTPAKPVAASLSDQPQPQEGDVAPLPPAFPLPQTQPPAAPSAVTPPARHAADRPLVQSAPLTAPAKDAEPPQAAAQQGRHAPAGSGDFPRVQIVDAKDQPPPLGHMLSGRAAIVAQSGDSPAAPAKDATLAPKSGAAEQPAAALFGAAAQATPAAAQKAKGQSRTAHPGGAAQAAAGVQPTQASGAQVQQAAAPAQAAVQSGFEGALAAASNGPGQPGAGSPQAPRSEPLPLVGSGGPQTPQASLRTAEPAAAAKPRLPVPPRFIADQVAVQIQKSLSQGNDRISIQLKPAELGKVEVRLDVGHEGRVTAVITADRPDTLDLLQRDARILQHSLQDAGLRADSNSLSFELRSQGQAFDTAQNGPNGRGGFAETGPDDIGPIDRIAPPMRPEIVTNDRVDIHV